ncbi:MAG: NHL repeat-containing protein [Phycisphaerae bacterium]|jgi:hypothetical protein
MLRAPHSTYLVLLVIVFLPTAGVARTVTEIIFGRNILVEPRNIAVDRLGNVYVTGYMSTNAFKITANGVITEIIDILGDGAGHRLGHPYGIAVSGSGNVYVTGATSDNAFKITPDGVITEIIDATGDGMGNQLASPHGIVVDESENVYVTGWHSDNVFRITPDGIITEIIDDSGDGLGKTLRSPTGIVVDDAGLVYVAGGGSHNAFRIELCDTLAHYSDFASCTTGPEGVSDSGCSCPDDDADEDVDLFDFARFQRTFVGH